MDMCCVIRASVGMRQVKSHVTRIKLPKNSARMPNQVFKTNQKSLTGQYSAIHMPKSVVCGSSALRENPFTRDFTSSINPRGLPLTEISYTSAEISNEILKSLAKSEIFREIPKSLKSLPKSAKS